MLGPLSPSKRALWSCEDTSGGRVLGVTALGGTIPEAIKLAYEGAAKIDSDTLYYRKDIGKKALKYL